ncbi:MAG: hypothetical protein ACE5JS_10810 [Nitrospinota bacterium]
MPHRLGCEVPERQEWMGRILKAARFALQNYYRRQIHLFYSTTSVHKSAIQMG